MKIDIQHISVKEHWKDWLYNSFKIYKAGMLSHTAIYLIAFMLIFSIMPHLSEGMSLFFLLFYFIFITPYFLIYAFGMLYKKDATAPDFKNVDFSFPTLIRLFKLQIAILVFFFTITTIMMGLSELVNTETEASAGASESGGFLDYDIYDYLLFTGTYTFQYAEFIMYFSYLVLYAFCNKSIFQSLALFNSFLLEKRNFGVCIISLLVPSFILGVLAELPSEFKIVYIALTPYLMSWHYVVFKHGFLGMKPEKQEEREKVDNNAYHMN